MKGGAGPLPPAAGDPADADPPPRPERHATATLSQWQLIRLRFSKHKLAVISLRVLIVLYAIAVGAEFIAPYSRTASNVAMIYCPPQTPRFSFRHGLHADALQRQIDPITLKSYYIRTGERIPLGFLVRGAPCKLWGVIPLDRRLFGVRGAPAGEGSGSGAGTGGEAGVAGDPGPGRTFHLLGADRFGRDVFSRMVYGARISLSIGLVAILVTFALGSLIGGVSGYVGGATDNLIQRGIEVINSFPQLPLWLAFAAILPSDWTAIQTYFAITIVLSLLGWTGLARVVRGKILSLREEDYAVAARLLGASHGRIIFRHLLPGFTSHIIVSLSLSVPGMILGETALSFLGLGLRPPVVSWGVMLQDCLNIDVMANYPWLLMPVILIIITVLAFNFFGDGMRDAADPYSAK